MRKKGSVPFIKISLLKVLFGGGVWIITIFGYSFMADAFELRGKLLGVTTHINQLDLRTMETKLVVRSVGGYEISKIDQHRFVYSLWQGDSAKIRVHSTKTGEDRLILSGRNQTYLKKHEKLIYYASIKGRGEHLLITDFKDLEGARKVVYRSDAAGNFPHVVPVQVSDNILLAPGPWGKKKYVYEINAQDGSYKPSPIGRGYPMLWLAKYRQVLCLNPDSEKYFLINLDGTNRIKWSKQHRYLKNATERPILYISELDVLIFSRSEWAFPIGGKGVLYAYHIGSNKVKRLFEGFAISSGQAIWIDE